MKLKQIQTVTSMTFLAVVLVMPGLVNMDARAEESGLTDQERAAQSARGAMAWSEQCGRCHNIRSPNEFTDDIWDVSVNHMHIRANIPADVIGDIKAFLKSNN